MAHLSSIRGEQKSQNDLSLKKAFHLSQLKGIGQTVIELTAMQRTWKIQVHPLTMFCMHLADGLLGCGQIEK
jgi:hypothetical protein